ncbi:MAG: PIN domain-containing protein [Rudaea sp.]
MRTNYVLIDYENVQPATLAGLDAEQFKLLLFVGANQAKLPFDVASAMQALGTRAQYIKIAGNGPNALDFHIAYYIGQLAAQDPTGCFHIISKDTGFDPLIQHLKARKMTVTRSKTIADILPKAAKAKPVPEKAAVVLKNLKQRGASKPRTLKTLSSTIRSLFKNQLDDAELKSLLAELTTRGFILVSGSKVSYALPEGDA